MSQSFYNLNTLVQVQVWDFYPVREFVYTPAIEACWWKFRKARPEGFEYGMFATFYIKEEIEGKSFGRFGEMIVKDNKVFDKPQVKLTFANDHSYSKNFDTYNDAVNWGSEQAYKGNNVILKIK